MAESKKPVVIDATKLKRKVPKKLALLEAHREMIEALPPSTPKEPPKPTESNPKGAGRPPAIDKITLGKLETAFSYGCTDREACVYAGINPSTLYDYQRDYPEFTERKALLQELPQVSARQGVVASFGTRPDIGLRYLEAKLPKEFNTKVNHHLTGEVTINYGEETRKRAEKYAQPNIAKRGHDAGPVV